MSVNTASLKLSEDLSFNVGSQSIQILSKKALDFIGHGGFGNVYKYNNEYAIKKAQKNDQDPVSAENKNDQDLV
jgi:hypothetical protein